MNADSIMLAQKRAPSECTLENKMTLTSSVIDLKTKRTDQMG